MTGLELSQLRRRIEEMARAALPGPVRLLGTGTRSSAGTALMSADARAGPAVVVLPGRWCSSSLWAVVDPERDLRVRMAVSGVPSVTVRYRSSTSPLPVLPPDRVAEVRTRDLLADVAHCVRDARDMHPGREIVLCGYSMGASLAFLAASGSDVAGLIALDGGLPAKADRCRLAAGCVANPYSHPRFTRSAMAALTSGWQCDTDLLCWRLSQDDLWSAAQLDEIRSGVLEDGRRTTDLVKMVSCPLLAVSAGDRDPVDDRRAARTACMTRSSRRIHLDLPSWTHDEIWTGRSDDVYRAVMAFLDGAT